MLNSRMRELDSEGDLTICCNAGNYSYMGMAYRDTDWFIVYKASDPFDVTCTAEYQTYVFQLSFERIERPAFWIANSNNIDMGIIDTLVMHSIDWDPKRPFETYREYGRQVMDYVDGRCKVHWPVSAYSFRRKGLLHLMKLKKLSQVEVARRFMRIARLPPCVPASPVARFLLFGRSTISAPRIRSQAHQGVETQTGRSRR